MYCRPRDFCALIAWTLLAVVPSVSSAKTLHVSQDSKTGFNTIQAAVDAAVDGDIIVIDAGIYTGPGNRDIDLRGKAITIQGADPANSDVVEATVIDCQGSDKSPHRGFYLANCNGAAISGLTITNGLATAGGAVYCQNGTLELTHCRIVGNATLPGGDGGGVYATSSVVYVLNCVVADNTAGAGGNSDFAPGRGGYGGGIYCDSLLVEDSTISGNAAGKGGDGIQAAEGGKGGGIYCTRAAIKNCIIEANTAGAGGDSTNGEKGLAGQGGDGGGIFCADSLEIVGSLIAGNRCGSNGLGLTAMDVDAGGGGIWCYLGVIDHCTIVSNAAAEQAKAAPYDVKAATDAGAGVFCAGAASITGSVVWGNTPDQLIGLGCESVAYCDIEGGLCPADQGNISADPLFVQPGHWASLDDPRVIVEPGDPGAVWVAGNYRLADGSPCIDAGDPNYAPDPNATDLDGRPRLAGRATDIGAYEFQSLVPVYRFWSSLTGKHFFTADEVERAALVQQPEIWIPEGIAYYAYASAGEPNVMPVYRFWSDKLSSHFWTISEAERDSLIDKYADAWTYEGPVFYAYPEGGQPTGAKPVYRFWSDDLGAHFYTISETEKDALLREYADTWLFEGIVWYAFEARSGDEEPPTAQAGEYEFACDRAAASYGLELKAYFDGREAQIDNPSIDLASTTGRMTMAVDFSGMTAELTTFQVESDLVQHAAVIRESDSGGMEFPLVLSISGFLDTLTPRGPFAIDPQTLAFSTAVGGQTSIGDEVFRIVGSALVEGEKHDVNLALAATDFEVEGVAMFDNSGYPGRLDVNMDGPFQWRRQQHEDLVLEATFKGHLLQVYVASVHVRATGLWLGKSASGEVKTTK
jgi:hypothetical protein